MAIRVLAVGNNNTTQEDHRRLIAGLTTAAGSSAHRAGLFPSSASAAITNVSAMVAGIGAFKAIVPNPAGGSYLVNSDSTINVTFDPGEAGVARTDRIIVRVYNNSQDASGKDGAFVEYLKGQSSGAGSAVPSNAILLYDIPVPAGASTGNGGINFTAIADDVRFYTVASGGIIPVSDPVNIGVSNPYEGQAVYVKDIDAIYIFDGAVWRCRSTPNVASFSNLSSIVNPYDGLTAFVRDVDVLYVYNGSSWQPVFKNGMVGKAVDAAVVAAPTTESTILTITNMIFKAGTAYRAFLRTGLNGPNGAQCLFQIRKTNSTGTQLGEYGRVTTLSTAVGSTVMANGSLIINRSASTNLTTNIVLTAAASASVNLWASTVSPRSLIIEPIGLASDYAGLGVDIV